MRCRDERCSAMAQMDFFQAVKAGKEGMPEIETKHSPDFSGAITVGGNRQWVNMTGVLVEEKSHISLEEHEMTAVDMKKRIVEIIATQLGIDQADITPQANVVDDLGADSLDVVELIMALEEEFNLEIPDDEAEKIKNVQDIFTYMESALQAA